MKKRVAWMVPVLLLAGCGGYIPSGRDVVNTHGEVKNHERLLDFISHSEKGVKDKLRVVSYTTEGDAMLQDLEFDGKLIKSRYDSTRDQYGDGDVTYASCKTIEMKEHEEELEYKLTMCGKDNSEMALLTISKK
ncbi:DUF4362 domain-containing protein [Metabacillus sp. KIGAM252]|uniref:DUF4362 domain-containing protein n=1 Tax=Metabacillus flavus TaxID=2823519 RepID=A0ABS5LBH9_9BACI|nr:DUF4362 domain-containing protein [Metabacillus flavus]MBS2968075.1 DUF4362 domain-containing protein [Metabacillus flavus]